VAEVYPGGAVPNPGLNTPQVFFKAVSFFFLHRRCPVLGMELGPVGVAR